MKEYLFRGKSVKTGELVIGFCVSPYIFSAPPEDNCSWIFVIHPMQQDQRNTGWIKVYTDTVGMGYPGRVDNKGKPIFEGDRVKCEWWSDYSGSKVLGTVRIVDGCFTVEFDEPQYDKLDEIWRPRLYVKCFTVNHALEVI